MDVKLNPAKIILTLALVWAGIIVLSAAGQVYYWKISPPREARFLEQNNFHAVREQAAAGDVAAAERLAQLQDQRQKIRDPRGVVRLFSVDGEARIPALFQTLVLFAIAITLWVIATHTRRGGDAMAVYWRILAFGFLFMAIDEACSIHENFYFFSGQSETQRQERMGGLFYYSWTLTALIIVAIVGAVFIRFLLRQPRRLAGLMVLAGFCYVVGAVGLEMAAGKYISSGGVSGLRMSMLQTIEESLELLGLLIFLYALLSHAADRAMSLRIRADRTAHHLATDAATSPLSMSPARS